MTEQNDIKRQPGCVWPDEYDFVSAFNMLDTCHPYTEMDTGKVLGLALAYQATTQERDALKEQLARAERVIEAANNLYSDSWDIPASYADIDDEAGCCVHCDGWNMNHEDDCSAILLLKALNAYKERSDE